MRHPVDRFIEGAIRLFALVAVLLIPVVVGVQVALWLNR